MARPFRLPAVAAILALGLSAALATGATAAPRSAAPALSAVSKVMVIADENKVYSAVIGNSSAPYLTGLADTHGNATNFQAGYPTSCPSLPAYILMTSGATQGICDDDNPSAHPLNVPSVLQQVQAAGHTWRGYAESMPSDCYLKNSGFYLVRHAPANYYTPIRSQCSSWEVPLGPTSGGAFVSAINGGSLPSYAFVTPNACDDMHGATGCPSNLVKAGDTWMSTWMPKILAGPDYTSGKLAIIVTWDEGSASSNHIPTLVLSAHTGHVSSGTEFTHCSTLRTSEELLGLPLLGCAASATSMVSAFTL